MQNIFFSPFMSSSVCSLPFSSLRIRILSCNTIQLSHFHTLHSVPFIYHITFSPSLLLFFFVFPYDCLPSDRAYTDNYTPLLLHDLKDDVSWSTGTILFPLLGSLNPLKCTPPGGFLFKTDTWQYAMTHNFTRQYAMQLERWYSNLCWKVN